MIRPDDACHLEQDRHVDQVGYPVWDERSIDISDDVDDDGPWLRDPLLTANLVSVLVTAHSSHLGFVLDELDQRTELSGPQLLDAIVATERLTGWVTAVQQQLLTRFARPGVAAPISQVLDAALAPGADLSITEHHRVQPLIDDLHDDQRAYTDTAVYGDPAWTAIIAEHAARLAATEIGAALMISPLTARDRVERAIDLTTDLPAVAHALRAGTISPAKARLIADTTRTLPTQLRRHIADTVLPTAATLPPSRLRHRIHRTALALDPDAATHRAAHAHRGRRINTRPLGDDQSRFTADLSCPGRRPGLPTPGPPGPHPAPRQHRRPHHRPTPRRHLHRPVPHPGRHRHHQPAHHQHPPHHHRTDPADHHPDDQQDNGDDHTPRQPADNADPVDPVDAGPARRSADTNHGPAGPAPHPWAPTIALTVTIGLNTLTELDNLPGHLQGHGPITADLARTLAHAATTIGLAATCTHPPHTTAPQNDPTTSTTSTHHSRRIYRPPATIDDQVRTRDEHCQFPGCATPAHRCDLDHRQPYHHGGPTCPCNLDTLCRYHHRTKTFTTWTTHRTPNGTLAWTSPLGRTYTETPHQPPTHITDLRPPESRRRDLGLPDLPADDQPPF